MADHEISIAGRRPSGGVAMAAGPLLPRQLTFVVTGGTLRAAAPALVDPLADGILCTIRADLSKVGAATGFDCGRWPTSGRALPCDDREAVADAVELALLRRPAGPLPRRM